MPTFDGYARASSDAASQAPEWSSFETGYFKVCHQPDTDLKIIERRLHKRSSYFEEGRGNYGTGIEGKIAYQLDMLCNKAQDILDMRPYLNKIVVKIFSDEEELDKEYFEIFHVSKNFKSFYIHAYKTIYTSEENISDSLIVHEMAHAIVDHYFSVLPPAKVSEVLASYVDIHLED